MRFFSCIVLATAAFCTTALSAEKKIPTTSPSIQQPAIVSANQKLASLGPLLEPFFLDMASILETESDLREQCADTYISIVLAFTSGPIDSDPKEPATPPTSTQPTTQPSRQFPEEYEYVRTFADALKIGCQLSPSLKKEKAEETIYETGLYLEHLNPKIASAASLWQGVLFYRLEQTERALLVLPTIDKPFEADTWTWELTGKLFRCQVIAKNGGYPTALVLLRQLKELIKAEDCGIPKDERENCIAAIDRLTRAILAAWSDARPDDPAHQKWCEEKIRKLPEPKENVLPLKQTVPMYRDKN